MYHSDLVQHRGRMRQIIAFEDLKFGSITPMDIDMCIEYHNKAVILGEYKYRDAEMPYGQQLCLRRLADDFQRAGKESVVLLCEHDVEDTRDDVKAGEAIVNAVYYRNKWYKGDGSTVKQYVERFLQYIQKNI